MLRHEPGVAGGTEAFLGDLKLLTCDRTLDELKLLAEIGQICFVAALGTHQNEPCAYIDLYRVENDVVMEHWGFFQKIPPLELCKSSNVML